MSHQCPFCQVELLDNEKTGNMYCSQCTRSWYETECDGEKTLASRTRSIRMTKIPEVGDKISDVIKPIES